MVNAKNDKRILMLVVAVFLISFMATAFAWFSTAAEKDIAKITGNTKYLQMYFAAGSGTYSDPFIISEPEHVKNLAWLQYQGYFNKTDKNGRVLPTFFKVAALNSETGLYSNYTTIDMSGWTIPPIGTEKYPFIGVLTGQRQKKSESSSSYYYSTIKNLSISNSPNKSDYKDNTGKCNAPPEIESSGVKNINVIGFFGVLDRTLGTSYYSSQKYNCLYLRLTALTVNVKTSQALAGLAAGYVGGNRQILSNVRIDNTSKIVTNGAAAYKTSASGTVYNTTDNLSNYALIGNGNSYNVGQYKTTEIDIAKPTKTASSTGGGGSSDPPSWGGSLSMKDLSNRLDTMYSSAENYTYYKKVTRYIYADGTVKETGTDPVTTSLKHYHNDVDGVADASGSVAFTNSSSLFGGNFHSLYGEKEFSAIRTVTTNTELGSNEFYISDGVYYLNLSVNVTDADKINNCKNPTIWKFNSDGTITTVVDGTTYYLKGSSGTLTIDTSSSGAGGWIKNTNRIYTGQYYLACDNANKKWTVKTYSGNKFNLTDGFSHYLGRGSSLINSKYYVAKSVSSTNKLDFYFEQGSSDKTKQKIYCIVDSKKYYFVLSECGTDTTSKEYASTNMVLTFVKEGQGTPDEFDLGYNYIKITKNSKDYYLQYNSMFRAYPSGGNTSSTSYMGEKWSFRTLTNPKSYRLYYTANGTKYYIKIGTKNTSPGSNYYYIQGTTSSSDATIWNGDGAESGGVPTGTLFGNGKSASDSEAYTFMLRYESGLYARGGSGFYSNSTSYPWSRDSNGKMSCKSYYIVGNTTGNWSAKSSASNGSVIQAEVAYDNPVSIDPSQWGVGMNFGAVVQHTSGGTWQEVTKTESDTYKTPDTYIPLVTETISSLQPKNTNPGYFISGANSHNSTDISTISGKGDSQVNKEYYQYGNLYYSNNHASSYKGSELQVLTRTADTDGMVRISDNYNQGTISNPSNADDAIRSYPIKDYSELGLTRYEEARKQLHTQLLNDDDLYGIHFMNAPVNEHNFATAKNVKINGEEKTDYQLPRDSFDFSCSSSGCITVFAGSYYSGTIFNRAEANDSLFSLHQVIRKENGDIDHINEIEKIYKTGDDQYTYIFSDSSDSPPAGAKLVFDMDWLKDPDPALLHSRSTIALYNDDYFGALYYYEIPVNAGEYALGAVSDKTGAYLLYLDIGTTPATQTVTTEKFEITSRTETVTKGVDFVSYTSTYPCAALSISAGTSGTVSFYRATSSVPNTLTVKSTGPTLTAIQAKAGTKIIDGNKNQIPWKTNVTPVVQKRTTVVEKNSSTKTTTTHVTTLSTEKDTDGNNTTVEITRKNDTTGEVTEHTTSRRYTDETPVMGSERVLGYGHTIPISSSYEAKDEWTLSELNASSGKYTIEVSNTKGDADTSAFKVFVRLVADTFNTSTLNDVLMKNKVNSTINARVNDQ